MDTETYLVHRRSNGRKKKEQKEQEKKQRGSKARDTPHTAPLKTRGKHKTGQKNGHLRVFREN
jgi:hypothetical protein